MRTLTDAYDAVDKTDPTFRDKHYSKRKLIAPIYLCVDCGHPESAHETETDNSYCLGSLHTDELPCRCKRFKANE